MGDAWDFPPRPDIWNDKWRMSRRHENLSLYEWIPSHFTTILNIKSHIWFRNKGNMERQRNTMYHPCQLSMLSFSGLSFLLFFKFHIALVHSTATSGSLSTFCRCCKSLDSVRWTVNFKAYTPVEHCHSFKYIRSQNVHLRKSTEILLNISRALRLLSVEFWEGHASTWWRIWMDTGDGWTRRG